MNRKQQGDIGVAMAIAYYTKKGYGVSVPLTDNLRYDLLVDTGEEILRVQVKCTDCKPKGYYVLGLRTMGGNTSWSGLAKRISATEADLVFAYVVTTHEMYEFPVEVVAGKSELTLGLTAQQYLVSL